MNLKHFSIQVCKFCKSFLLKLCNISLASHTQRDESHNVEQREFLTSLIFSKLVSHHTYFTYILLSGAIIFHVSTGNDLFLAANTFQFPKVIILSSSYVFSPMLFYVKYDDNLIASYYFNWINMFGQLAGISWAVNAF